jgi:hypothetical protein
MLQHVIRVARQHEQNDPTEPEQRFAHDGLLNVNAWLACAADADDRYTRE